MFGSMTEHLSAKEGETGPNCTSLIFPKSCKFCLSRLLNEKMKTAIHLHFLSGTVQTCMDHKGQEMACVASQWQYSLCDGQRAVLAVSTEASSVELSTMFLTSDIGTSDTDISIVGLQCQQPWLSHQ